MLTIGSDITRKQWLGLLVDILEVSQILESLQISVFPAEQ